MANQRRALLLKEGADLLKTLKTDFSELDKFIDKMVWTLANLMPLCLMKAIETVRVKKRFFWDRTKMDASYWLAANMNMEAWLGFNAFNTEDITGRRTIDFIKYRQLIAQAPKWMRSYSNRSSIPLKRNK